MSDEYTQQLEETNEKLRKRLEEETTRADKLQGELDKLNAPVVDNSVNTQMNKWKTMMQEYQQAKFFKKTDTSVKMKF